MQTSRVAAKVPYEVERARFRPFAVWYRRRYLAAGGESGILAESEPNENRTPEPCGPRSVELEKFPTDGPRPDSRRCGSESRNSAGVAFHEAACLGTEQG